MNDQEDVMLTFRQKIQLNNNEHMFFRQDVDSWRNEMQNQQGGPTTLEDISYIDSSDEEETIDAGDEFRQKGNGFLEKGEWARAISMYTSALSKNGSAKNYTARALAHLKRGRSVEAEKDCTEAINLDPGYTKAYIRRALARKLLGKCKESSDDMEVILRHEPDNSIIATEYDAMLDYLQKNLPQSEDSSVEQDKLETATKLKQLGNDLISKCQFNKAIQKLTSAINLKSTDPTFYANRAICYMKLKDFVSAEKDCSKALELDGKYAKVYLRRARVRKYLGKLYDSRQDFYSTFELTQDGKVLEEMEEIEIFIRQEETSRRKNGEKLDKYNLYSIIEKDEAGRQKIVQLDFKQMKNKHQSSNEVSDGNGSSKSFKDNSTNSKPDHGLQTEVSKGVQNSALQTKTDISIPLFKSDTIDEHSAKYDIREVFPLKPNDPSVKFTGPFIRVMIDDGKFAAPQKLWEIPDEIIRKLLPH